MLVLHGVLASPPAASGWLRASPPFLNLVLTLVTIHSSIVHRVSSRISPHLETSRHQGSVGFTRVGAGGIRVGANCECHSSGIGVVRHDLWNRAQTGLDEASHIKSNAVPNLAMPSKSQRTLTRMGVYDSLGRRNSRSRVRWTISAASVAFQAVRKTSCTRNASGHGPPS